MLEVILDRHLLFVLMGVFAVIGIVSKGVVSFSLKSLTKAAGNMSKSSHGLIRLVRAKYEHACMVSDKVQNVEAFIEKYIYEYKIAGIRLHSWRRLEKLGAWGCLIAGLLAAAGEYLLRGMSDQVLKNAVYGAVAGILLFLLRITMDENYRLNVIRTYMVDYLDNVCARKFEKNREISNPERPRPREEVPAPGSNPEILPPVMPEPYRVPETYQSPETNRAPETNRTPETYQAPDTGRQPEGMKAAERKDAEEPERVKKVEIIEELEETEMKRTEPKGKKAAKSATTRPKEVLIREILEEFLA